MAQRGDYVIPKFGFQFAFEISNGNTLVLTRVHSFTVREGADLVVSSPAFGEKTMQSVWIKDATFYYYFAPIVRSMFNLPFATYLKA